MSIRDSKKARLETSVEEEESRVKEEAEARRQAEAEALNQLRMDKPAKISAAAPADNEEEAARIRQEYDEDLERLKVNKQTNKQTSKQIMIPGSFLSFLYFSRFL